MKRWFAWIGLGLCLIVAISTLAYQIYSSREVDLLAVTFGFAGIIAAIAALFVTETTLEHLKKESEKQIIRLSGEITNLEDATRRNLTGFAEIFARALWLLRQAQEEIWYINFLFGFGEPHQCNPVMAGDYAKLAKVLHINPVFQSAVREFYTTLLDKISKTPVFCAVTLKETSLRGLCLEKLQKTKEYSTLVPDQIIDLEKRHWQAIENARGLRDSHELSAEDCKIEFAERLPLQLLIARIPSRGGDDRKWGCLVFLVGTENVGNHKPRGFYTELDHVVDVYKELALGFMQPEIPTVPPLTSAPAEAPVERLH